MTQTTTEKPPPYDQATGQLGISVVADPHTDDVLVTLTPPKDGQRVPADICCVIDVSGSMDAGAPLPSVAGKPAEDTGLTILDVVKHALRTIVAGMGPDDRIALVTFSDAGKVLLDFTLANDTGKKAIESKIESMRTEGSTNLWDGLKVGMNLVHACESTKAQGRLASILFARGTATSQKRLASIFLLTDGAPNVQPPRGHIPMLKTWLDSHPESNFLINTFGFGYSLDSRLLVDIANTGNGTYGFIPDSGMVGTVFVHAVANTFSIFATDCKLWVEPSSSEAQIYVVEKGAVSASGHIPLGSVQFGQTRDTVLRLKGYKSDKMDSLVTFTVQYKPCGLPAGSAKAVLTRGALVSPESDSNLVSLKHHTLRSDLIHALQGLFLDEASRTVPAGSAEKFTAIETAIAQMSTTSPHPPSVALSQDISGQILTALGKQEYYAKWGRHYLPSLARAHYLQQCNNFKDPGVQVYGAESPMFIKAREVLDAAFDNLPPPKPSSRAHSSPASSRAGYGWSSVPSYAPVSSMAEYNSRAGPCFDGGCRIHLANGSHIPIAQLKRGMQVLTPVGSRRVAAIVRTQIVEGELPLCVYGNLKVTPWHPVHDPRTEEWTFPCGIVEPQITPCDAVFSILLEPDTDDTAHAVSIEGVRCVTLGHGIVDPERRQVDLRSHVFLGDYQKVLASIANLPGFRDEEGVAFCAGIVRGGIEGEMVGFLPAKKPMRDLAAGNVVRVSVLV